MKTPALVLLALGLATTAVAQTTAPTPAVTPRLPGTPSVPSATPRNPPAPVVTPRLPANPPATPTTPPTRESGAGSPAGAGVVVPQTGAAGAGGGAAMRDPKRVACKEVRLSWLATTDTLSRGPETIAIVKNEAGASGIRFFVDRNGAIVGVKTWTNYGGVMNSSTIPGMPKIDWVDCHDSDPIGGIWVEYADASTFGP